MISARYFCVGQWIKRIVVAMAISALLLDAGIANANPVGDFFKRVGRSLEKAGKSQPPRRTRPANPAKKTTTGTDAQKQSGSPESPSPSPTPTFTPSVRAAVAAPEAKGGKRDAPFGIPVPGKKGLVTSPFSPDSYIDVRAFPPGSEVKDPYTGKVFRVP